MPTERCPHGCCPYCEQEERDEAEKAEVKEIVSRWSWDMSPAEVARDIEVRDWDMDEIAEVMEEVGFSESDIEAVRDCHDVFCS
jgi:histone acetyltransferase (RNA polymerase elongator complex component)